MAVYNSKLYVGTWNPATGAEVWRYNGTAWNQVNTDGFGDANNMAASSMAVDYNSLYVGTQNLITGGEVWLLTPLISVPTLNEWGMIILVILLGIGSAYKMRQKTPGF
jgi:hypothetical protein